VEYNARTFFRREAVETSHASQQEEIHHGRSLAWIAAGIIASLVLVLLIYALAVQPPEPPQVGSPVPDFSLNTLDGTSFSLSTHQGQVVVVNFFASWCDPCRQEAADLEQTWRQYEGQGVQFFGIAYKDASSKAQAFLSQFDVTYPFTAEPGNRTARLYGVTGVPETFVIDRQGRLVQHFIGPVTQAELSLAVDRALGQ
jgi:cytochrome c biogenesis protein CcmG/thiol:disulfide interchange protein DsbE